MYSLRNQILGKSFIDVIFNHIMDVGGARWQKIATSGLFKGDNKELPQIKFYYCDRLLSVYRRCAAGVETLLT